MGGGKQVRLHLMLATDRAHQDRLHKTWTPRYVVQPSDSVGGGKQVRLHLWLATDKSSASR